MKRGIWMTVFLLIFAGMTLSCNINDPDEFTPEYVVEAYLFAREQFPAVRLSRTVPFGTTYHFEEQAVAGATVRIHEYIPGGILRTIQYVERNRGYYLPRSGGSLVQPQQTYELEISFPDNNTVLRSRTVVPDTFHIVATTPDTLVYQATRQFELTVTPSFYPGRQNIFLFSTESLDPRVDQLTPFIADLFDPATDDLVSLRMNESPPINEENYDRNPDGTLTIRLPWIAINFFGPNRITISAIDQNIFDFVRSQNIQVLPSTLSPGEIPNVIDPIEGGTGIFGSFARVQKEIFVRRP